MITRTSRSDLDSRSSFQTTRTSRRTRISVIGYARITGKPDGNGLETTSVGFWKESLPLPLKDSAKYPKVSAEGKFFSWWETYFRDEGLDSIYCPFTRLYAIPQHEGAIVGLLGMDIPHLKAAHIVAVDELGVIDPADNAPDHIPLPDYIRSRLPDGVFFHNEWLAIRRRATK